MNGAFKPTLDETALEQIEVAEKKLYDLASVGQTEGGFKPFRAALTEAMVAAEAAYNRAGQLTGVATGLFQLDQLLGGLHRSDLIILAGRPSMGKTRARDQHRASTPPRPIARSMARTASPRWSTAPSSASSRWKCRPSSSPPACSRSRPRSPSEKIRKGELISSDFDQVLAVSHELEHLNFFIDDTPALSHRRPAHPRPPPEAHARARPADRRLPPAPQPVGQDRARRTACRRSRRSPAVSRRWPRNSTCRCWRCRSSAAPSSSARTSGRSSPTCANRARSSRTPTS